jgi:PAS fold.
MTPSEQKLNEQIQRLSETLDHVGAYVFTKDPQGRYTYANKMVCNLFESRLSEIIGLTDSAFFDLSTFNQLQKNDRRVLDHGEHIESEENNIIIASGELRTYWSVKKPIKNDHGQIIGMCGIFNGYH